MRALIGSTALLVYLIAYVIAVVTLADHVPGHWAAQLLYYAAAGVIWVAPLRPLLRWMQSRPAQK